MLTRCALSSARLPFACVDPSPWSVPPSVAELHTDSDTLSAKTGPLAQPRAHKCAHRTARGRAAANAERTRSTFTP